MGRRGAAAGTEAVGMERATVQTVEAEIAAEEVEMAVDDMVETVAVEAGQATVAVMDQAR